MMPTLLAIETATDACSCALSKDHVVFARFKIAPRQHAELILLMIEELLSEAACSLASIEAIAFGCGPGSFMGVRLATAVAQGLGFSRTIPVVSVSTLQSLAQRAAKELGAKHVVAAWDARLGEVYWGGYVQNEAGLMWPLDQDHLSHAGAIDVPPHYPWVLVGNAWAVYQAQLQPALQLEPVLLYPQAAAMLPLAAYLFKQGRAQPAATIEPNYLRQQVAHKKIP